MADAIARSNLGSKPVWLSSGMSTTHALVAVLHKWMEILDKRGSVRALFIDYRKVFDIVNHNTLLSKLKKYNV